MADKDKTPTAHLFCGLPFSGKTRQAKEIEAHQDAVRFSLDEWVTTLFGYSLFDAEYKEAAARCHELIMETAVRLLSLGTDVILDWNLWSRELRHEMITTLKAVEANHILYYLNIPKVVLRERLAEYNVRVGNDNFPNGRFISNEEFARFLPLFEPPAEDEACNMIEMYFGHDQPIHNSHLDGAPFYLDGGKVGILLAHGLTATTAEVRLLAERLHQQGYTVSGPLLPGHGSEPDDLNQITWHDWVWEVEKSYQYLATVCDQVFVGGESTGAVLALDLATRYPEIAGVLCYAPAIKLAMDTSALIRLYVSAPLVDSIPKSSMGNNEFWQGYRVYPLRGVVELIRLGLDVRRRLEKIEQPILLMLGKHDQTIHPECGNIIMDEAASAEKERHLLKESGHIILLEDELDEIEATTLQFMEKYKRTTLINSSI